MHNKQTNILIQPAHLTVVLTSNLLVDAPENNFLGKLLTSDTPKINHDRFANLLHFIATSYVPDDVPADIRANEIDMTVEAFTKIADEIKFPKNKFFESYLNLLQAQKGLSAKILGLHSIDQNAFLLIENIDTENDVLLGTPADKISVISFTVAHSILSDSQKLETLSFCYESLSAETQKSNSHHFEEFKLVLDMLRFRINPDGEEGTVLEDDGNSYVVWNTGSSADNDDVASESDDSVSDETSNAVIAASSEKAPATEAANV